MLGWTFTAGMAYGLIAVAAMTWFRGEPVSILSLFTGAATFIALEAIASAWRCRRDARERADRRAKLRGEA